MFREYLNKYRSIFLWIRLQVIVLPHSHVDPGWLKTFENYYAQSTHSILDNLVAKLTQHKNMTFIWTEISFFAIWWQRLAVKRIAKVWLGQLKLWILFFSAMPIKRRQVQKLVEEKRLEFTSATWVMVDEATPHLYSMLDQMIEGIVFFCQ